MQQHEELIPEKTQLVGHKQFKRVNPCSDRFEVHRFHHLEFYCGDATNVSRRFGWGLGLQQVAKSDHSTGNNRYASYVMKSHDLVFVFTAPYPEKASVHAHQRIELEEATTKHTTPSIPHPGYSTKQAQDFFVKHGLAVRAIGILVGDARHAFEACVRHGGQAILEPYTLTDALSQKTQIISEVQAYPNSDVVLRFVSGDFEGCYLPNYQPTPGPDLSYGIRRIDHVVGNVTALLPAVNYIMKMTGFHEFAEFTAEDVGTVDSGLNSMVLASNTEAVLLPINEPTFGTRRKSQIQTYLEQNLGAGVQHLALKTDNIYRTMEELRKRAYLGGFELMPKASAEYYRNLPERIGPILTAEEYKRLEELGLLADQDDQGVLLQVFTRPVGDRPTLFLEIIQRVGCNRDTDGQEMEQKPGCGGFGKGNFSELFRSIEEYERTLNV